MAHVISLSELALGRRAAQFEGAKYDSTISFFVTRHEQGAGPSPHRHPYAETFIVQAGAAAFTVDGELVEVGAGNVVVVPAGAVHSFKGAGSETLGMVSIHEAPEMVTEWLEEG